MILVSFQTDRYMQIVLTRIRHQSHQGSQCLPFCLHLFGSLCRKMILIKNGGCSFSYIRIERKLEESRHEKGGFLHMRKQRRSNREADQRLCFRNTVRTIHSLPKFEISSLIPSSVAEQPGLCWTWAQTPKTGFFVTRLNYGKTRVYRGVQFFLFSQP